MLITVEKVMLRLGMAPELHDQVQATVQEAIHVSQVKLETTLDTRLDPGRGWDIFHINPHLFNGIVPSGTYRCLLGNGFVRPTTTPTVISSKVWNMIDPQPVDPTLWWLDYRIGLIMFDPTLSDLYIRVDYTSGFDDGDDVASREPWIAEAQMALVPLVLDAGRSLGGDDKSGNQNVWASGGSLSEGLKGRYTRNLGLTIRPMRGDWNLL